MGVVFFQAKLRDVRNVMISVEQMCNDFMKEQNDKMARTEEMLVLRLQREKDAEIARKFATLTKENDAILEEHKAVVEAQLRQEFDAKFRRERSKILTEYAQHWEDALARADERQVMLENQFRDHVNEKRRAWKEKLERMQRMERDLCEAKIEALRISNPKRSLEVLDPALADKYVDTMEDFDDTLKDGSIEFHEKNNVGNQTSLDLLIIHPQEEANAKMRNILNGEQVKLAEALNHQAQLADLLQHEHEMAMKKLRSDLAQDFEARLKATLETERLNSKTTLVARLREAAKN
ncbi:unnamed protein product, partial [Notodromas monacha]